MEKKMEHGMETGTKYWIIAIGVGELLSMDIGFPLESIA